MTQYERLEICLIKEIQRMGSLRISKRGDGPLTAAQKKQKTVTHSKIH